MPSRRKKQAALQAEQAAQALQEGEVVGYVRVSTDEQAETGLGIGAQIAKIKTQALLKDWPEPRIFVDEGVSGTIPLHKRPQFQQILQAIEEKRVKAILTSSLDRIGRRANIIINFAEDMSSRKVIFISSKEGFDTATPYGQFAIIIMSAIAQLERDMIITRTKEALAEKSRINGEAGGRLPHGYKRVFDLVSSKQGLQQKAVNIEIDEEAAKIVRKIFRLRNVRGRNGRPMSLRRIADEVRKIAPKSPQGGEWYSSSIQDILNSEEVYRGGTRGLSAIHWPIIVSDEGVMPHPSH